MANGGSGSPGSSATAPSAEPPPTHTAAELHSIISLLQKGGDTATAAVYQEKLKALRAPSNAPKTLTYANAKRLAVEASKRLDKAAEKVFNTQEAHRAAKEDLAVATQQLREAEVTRDKVFAAEADANGKSLATNELKTTTICVDKVALGGEINIDFGELAAVIAEAPPEEQAKLKTMQEERHDVTKWV